MTCEEVKKSLKHSAEVLRGVGKWSASNPPTSEKVAADSFAGWDLKNLEKLLLAAAEKFNKDRGCLLWPLRVALSGKQASASPFEIAEILGKEKTLDRIQSAIDIL